MTVSDASRMHELLASLLYPSVWSANALRSASIVLLALTSCAAPAPQPMSAQAVANSSSPAVSNQGTSSASKDTLIPAQELNAVRLSAVLERLGYKCTKEDDGSVGTSHDSRFGFKARIDKDLERVTFIIGGKLKDPHATGLLEAANRANLAASFSTFAVSADGYLLISWCLGIGGGVTERQIDRFLTNASYEAKMLFPTMSEYVQLK